MEVEERGLLINDRKEISERLRIVVRFCLSSSLLEVLINEINETLGCWKVQKERSRAFG